MTRSISPIRSHLVLDSNIKLKVSLDHSDINAHNIRTLCILMADLDAFDNFVGL